MPTLSVTPFPEPAPQKIVPFTVNAPPALTVVAAEFDIVSPPELIVTTPPLLMFRRLVVEVPAPTYTARFPEPPTTKPLVLTARLPESVSVPMLAADMGRL